MIYQAYQAHADAMRPFRSVAEAAMDTVARFSPGTGPWPWMSNIAATCSLIARAGLSHSRRPFAIDTVEVGGRAVAVREEIVYRLPFCSLLRFAKDVEAVQPKVLLVAPMSGHFATLLRDTVRTMLPDHDVYITDWANARDVPLDQGPFGFDEFTDYLIRFLEVLGEGSHMLAVCQPCVSALAAAAVMAEDDHPAQPRSLILMAGPIDTRISPTKVNDFAVQLSLGSFEQFLIGVVPQGFKGALRRVYPGFLQLTAFMSMNLDRHMKSFQDMYNAKIKNDTVQFERISKFYEEYFSVMDLPAEFFLETIRRVFKEHDLPRGKLTWHGRPINPGAIRRTQLLTVEGDQDDICAIGQTLAAQDLCSGLRPYRKRHHMQPGVGHYGVFSGRRWAAQIYPVVRDLIYVGA
jgi:poly(3-hydroxybutyrate) depolymerase